jgi:hypothetical protein
MFDRSLTIEITLLGNHARLTASLDAQQDYCDCWRFNIEGIGVCSPAARAGEVREMAAAAEEELRRMATTLGWTVTTRSLTGLVRVAY